MTSFPANSFTQPRPSNALGIAGFVCSLVGLVLTGGLLCPIGLILSLVAVGRQPRGFAIAGVVLGLIGSCGGILIAMMFGAAILAGLGIAIAMVALSDPQRLELTSDMITIAIAVEKYRDENRYLPASLSLLGFESAMLLDPWGQSYRYDLQDPSGKFDLISSGKDTVFETPDDVRLSTLGKTWSPSANVSMQGDDRGGTVKVEVAGNTIEVVGDDTGGRVTFKVSENAVEVAGSPPTVPQPPSTPPAEVSPN